MKKNNYYSSGNIGSAERVALFSMAPAPLYGEARLPQPPLDRAGSAEGGGRGAPSEAAGEESKNLCRPHIGVFLRTVAIQKNSIRRNSIRRNSISRNRIELLQRGEIVQYIAPVESQPGSKVIILVEAVLIPAG